MNYRQFLGLAALVIAFSFFFCQRQNKVKVTEASANTFLNESQEDFDARMAWWRDAKFGLFIHWGLYAIPAGEYEGKRIPGIGEWIMQRAPISVAEYEKYAARFNPVKFDAAEWVRIAKDAGMKYIVITSKHHDGFCLWDSEVSDYDVMDASPFKRDILQELKDACDREGIAFAFYHSIMDWRHPDAQAPHYPTYNTKDKKNPNFPDYYKNYLKPQVKELVTKYDPSILWFDGEWIPEYTHEQGLEMYNFVRSLKPDILVNNRVDKGRQGMQGMNKDGDFAGDFGTPEQEILERVSAFDWESCMTMNETWGYKSYDHNWKSKETLIHNLIDIAAKGGNFLLNVGPTAEGLIPAPSIERLAAMGRWLKVNGEAIYATEKLQGHYKEGEQIRYVKKRGKNIYFAFTLEKPASEITFKYLKPAENSEIILLGSDAKLTWTYQENKGLTVHIPKGALEMETEAWVFKIIGEEMLK